MGSSILVGLVIEDFNRVKEKIDKKEFLIAYEMLQALLKEHPKNLHLQGFLGVLMLYLNDLDQGYEILKNAYHANPKNNFLLNNYGVVLLEKGFVEEAIDFYESQPSLCQSTELAFLYLRIGRFKEGLDLFENRRSKGKIVHSANKFDKQRWKGEPLKGKKILVVREQGYGDALHFINYLPKLSEQAQKVYFLPPKILESLFKENEDVLGAEILSHKDSWNSVDYDYYLPLMSLPKYLDPDFLNIHALQGKWVVNLKKQQSYKDKMDFTAKKHVAICWRGNSEHSRDHWRSIPFSYFLDVINKHPDWMFYSFVFDLSEEEKELFSKIDNLVDASNFISNFSDSAAFLSQLDVCISCDTSLVHLAGNLQVPTSLLLPYREDWRWKAPFSQGRLYPSVKLIKQKKYACWKGVFNELSQSL
jgi:tetratricopeptide (TPR) repeat protein